MRMYDVLGDARQPHREDLRLQMIDPDHATTMHLLGLRAR
jgi:hypothetical protein